MPPHVAVVGGGVAGIAAALRLAERGVRVTLLERTNRLGGRAGSFRDGSLDESIDNCQHVALGCCDQYLDLLADLGVADSMQWTSSFHFIEADGKTSTLPIPPWPSPLHGLPLLARAGFLSIGERASIARALAGVRLTGGDKWVGRSFASWLEAKRQPEHAIERFWTPIIVSACNARPKDCDAAAALKVFRDGFLRSHGDARMGVPSVPLSDLYVSTGERLAAADGKLWLGATVSGVEPGRVLLRSKEALSVDAVVLATPLGVTADLLDASSIAGSGVVENLRRIRHSPIVAVHAEFEESVSDLPHAVLLDAPFDWVFLKDAGRRVHAVASAADGLVGKPGEDLIGALTHEIGRRFGVDAPPVWSRVVKERRATFLVEPGVGELRPRVDELAPEVWIAGDYTDTGWPATMEGATRSGRLAAEGVLGRL
ncbi:MAG: hydroxysqualene dehydroxylase HpnE, partial [Planctomycetota bacterium]